MRSLVARILAVYVIVRRGTDFKSIEGKNLFSESPYPRLLFSMSDDCPYISYFVRRPMLDNVRCGDSQLFI